MPVHLDFQDVGSVVLKAWGCSRESRIGMANPNMTCLLQPPKITPPPTFPVSVVTALKGEEGIEGTWLGMRRDGHWMRLVQR